MSNRKCHIGNAFSGALHGKQMASNRVLSDQRRIVALEELRKIRRKTLLGMGLRASISLKTRWHF